MTAKPKFRVDSIEQAHRALDALPQHQPQEFTKAQAIQKLIVPIRAVQSKGYSLAAIAKVVSDMRHPDHPGALRLYAERRQGGRGREAEGEGQERGEAADGGQAHGRKQPAEARAGTPEHTQNIAPTNVAPTKPAAPHRDPQATPATWTSIGDPPRRPQGSNVTGGLVPAGFDIGPTRRTFEKRPGGSKRRTDLPSGQVAQARTPLGARRT